MIFIHSFTKQMNFIHRTFAFVPGHDPSACDSVPQDQTGLQHSWSLQSNQKRHTLIKNHKNERKIINVRTSKEKNALSYASI